VAVSRVARLTLTDFRSYERAELALGGSVYLFGPNGAGKTNLLEAVSLFTPGRGLRSATVAEIGRRLPAERTGRAWSVSALLDTGDDEPLRLGTGVEAHGAARRVVRIEGETVAPGRLLERLRPVWLTPAQDRLFLEGRSERLRFFDRLVFADDPPHATAVAAYEKASRERMRLLTDGPADPAWLDALEARLGEAGARMAAARARTLVSLQAEIEGRADRPFPQARLSLSGPFEKAAVAGETDAMLSAEISAAMRASRGRDAAAGRALSGPHRTDLEVVHSERGRPAAECSTGEQKALILNLVLAQAARLSRAISQPNPILLLDEVAAHLDPFRRGALFDEIVALGLQAFLTGTDEALFEGLKGRAQGVRVEAGRLTGTD
jgi:DNA replication and repair protein RecF